MEGAANAEGRIMTNEPDNVDPAFRTYSYQARRTVLQAIMYTSSGQVRGGRLYLIGPTPEVAAKWQAEIEPYNRVLPNFARSFAAIIYGQFDMESSAFEMAEDIRRAHENKRGDAGR